MINRPHTLKVGSGGVVPPGYIGKDTGVALLPPWVQVRARGPEPQKIGVWGLEKWLLCPRLLQRQW